MTIDCKKLFEMLNNHNESGTTLEGLRVWVDGVSGDSKWSRRVEYFYLDYDGLHIVPKTVFEELPLFKYDRDEIIRVLANRSEWGKDASVDDLLDVGLVDEDEINEFINRLITIRKRLSKKEELAMRDAEGEKIDKIIEYLQPVPPKKKAKKKCQEDERQTK